MFGNKLDELWHNSEFHDDRVPPFTDAELDSMAAFTREYAGVGWERAHDDWADYEGGLFQFSLDWQWATPAQLAKHTARGRHAITQAN